MEKEDNIYEKLFVENKGQRVEYGNNRASFEFFMEQEVPTDSSILEIGCNIGTLAHMLHSAGYSNLHAIDITSSAIALGKEQYKEIFEFIDVFDGHKLPFRDESFDVVVSFDVIEHIPDVDEHFQEVRRVLKKGGRYIYQTPNKLINIPWEIVNSRSMTAWKEYHCSLHTFEGLLNRMYKNNFHVDSITKRSLMTEYNQEKIVKKIGVLGIALIKLFEKVPVRYSPNFWVISRVKK